MLEYLIGEDQQAWMPKECTACRALLPPGLWDMLSSMPHRNVALRLSSASRSMPAHLWECLDTGLQPPQMKESLTIIKKAGQVLISLLERFKSYPGPIKARE